MRDSKGLMAAARKAEHDAQVAAARIESARIKTAQAARKAQRDARLADVPRGATLLQIRDILQGVIEELR